MLIFSPGYPISMLLSQFRSQFLSLFRHVWSYRDVAVQGWQSGQGSQDGQGGQGGQGDQGGQGGQGGRDQGAQGGQGGQGGLGVWRNFKLRDFLTPRGADKFLSRC